MFETVSTCLSADIIYLCAYYMNYLKVPTHLTDFCTEINERRLLLNGSDDIIEQYLLSFDAHYELVTIHPWVDGNGRMSRLIMNHLQFEYRLVPTKVNKDDKAEYIQALIDSREQETTEPFREFMLQEHIKNLKQEIATYKESVNEVYSKGGQKMKEVYRKGGQKTRDVILEMITNDEKVTSTQMAARLGINRSAVSKHLKKMQEEGIIKREGPDKGGKWKVTALKPDSTLHATYKSSVG